MEVFVEADGLAIVDWWQAETVVIIVFGKRENAKMAPKSNINAQNGPQARARPNPSVNIAQNGPQTQLFSITHTLDTTMLLLLESELSFFSSADHMYHYYCHRARWQ
jgi:hypothetical protein